MSNAASTSARLSQSREHIRLALYPADSSPIPAGWPKPQWMTVLKLADHAAGALLQPAAQRHPYGVVLSAAAIGAAVVLVRPWRWLSTPLLLAGILPTVLAAALRRDPVQGPEDSAKKV